MKIAKIAALAMVLWIVPALAQSFSPFVIEDIRVDGLRRFDPGVVFSRLPVDLGDTLNEEQADDIIKTLFDTGFFRSVEVQRDGKVLVVAVEENPTIAEVDFAGVEELSSDALEGMLKQAGILRGRVFDRALVEDAAQAIKAAYADRNYYQAEVETVVSPLPRNRLALLFNVDEGKQAAIRSIRFAGNERITSWTLRRQMRLESRGILNYFTDNYLFSESRLKSDLGRIRTLYLEAGYLKFKVEAEEVEVSADKKHIDILLRFSEGRTYAVAEAEVTGELPPELSEEDIRDHINQVPGELFSSRDAGNTVSSIREVLGNLGYAKAKVSYANELNDEDGTVVVTYTVIPGPVIYVREIRIVGNERTRDEVIRRELLQFERERYSRVKVSRSTRRVRRLGYFSNVNISQKPVSDREDEVDLEVKVREGSVGNFQIGGGFSSGGDLSFNAGIDTPNIFGSGNDFKTTFSWSDSGHDVDFSLDEYYHTDEGVSRHIGLQIGGVDAGENTAAYNIDGFSSEYGYNIPYADDGKYRLYFAYQKAKVKKVDSNYIKVADDPVRAAELFREGNDLDLLLMRSGLSHDTRDSNYGATDGQLIKIDVEAGLPPLDIQYYKVDYKHDYYYDLKRVPLRPVLHLGLGFGFGDGVGGDPYPFYHRYNVGGTGTLRGFSSNSIGAVVGTTPVEQVNEGVTMTVSERIAVGGKTRVYGTIELPVDTRFFETQRIDLSPYIDYGAVGGKLGELGDFRASAGVEVRWLSPIGPLRFSWSRALKKEPDDKIQELQFSISY